MELFATKYKNTRRTIDGIGNFVYKDDVFLLCDTSTGPVSLTLLDLPANFLNTVYKLYVIDSAGNAGTNNISISVPAGYTINNTAGPLILNNNGGSCIVRILDNNKYLADINYPNTIPSQDYDTGWLDMLGFEHIITPSLVPQFRIINREIKFRGVAVIPLAVAGVLVPYVNENSYINTPSNTPFVGGGPGSCSVYTTPSAPNFILGIRGSGGANPPGNLATLPPIIAGSSNRYPDNVYLRRDVCLYRRVKSPDGAHGVTYNVPVDVVFQTNGSLYFSLVNNYEDGNWNNPVKTDSRRMFGSNATAGEFYLDLGAVNFGNAAGGVPTTIFGFSDPAFVHPITVRVDDALTLGGFSLFLDGLGGVISRSTPLPVIHP